MDHVYVKGIMFIHSLSHKELRFVHNKGIASQFTLAWPYTPKKGFAHDFVNVFYKYYFGLLFICHVYFGAYSYIKLG